jgi:hypothetical protein
MYYPKFKLSRAYEEDLGFDGNMNRGVRKASTQFFFAVELFAKTFGVRRIITSEENILPFCCWMLVAPFILLIVVIAVENMVAKRNKLALVDKEKKDK